MENSVGIITQVRMTSSRLPGKVLKRIIGRPLLDFHLQRLQSVGAKLIVATTDNAADDPVVEYCKEKGVSVFRGSESHVLSRFHDAAAQFSLHTVVRVTSDCPLIDGDVLLKGLKSHLQLRDDDVYTSNVINRTYPRGLDFEIFSFKRLREAYLNAAAPNQIEHVTPFIHQNVDGKTKFNHITDADDLSSWRLTVDTPEDFELIRVLIEDFRAHELKWPELKRLLAQHIELKKLNAHIEQKKI